MNTREQVMRGLRTATEEVTKAKEEEDILETLKMRKDYDDELFKKYESTI